MSKTKMIRSVQWQVYGSFLVGSSKLYPNFTNRRTQTCGQTFWEIKSFRPQIIQSDSNKPQQRKKLDTSLSNINGSSDFLTQTHWVYSQWKIERLRFHYPLVCEEYWKDKSLSCKAAEETARMKGHGSVCTDPPQRSWVYMSLKLIYTVLMN